MLNTDKQIAQLIKVADQQKGELLYLHTLITSIMRAMPEEFQSVVFQQFLKDSESMRSKALFSESSEDVISTFELYVEALSRRPEDKY